MSIVESCLNVGCHCDAEHLPRAWVLRGAPVSALGTAYCLAPWLSVLAQSVNVKLADFVDAMCLIFDRSETLLR